MAIDFEPQTIVRILANVPLDNTYRNTIDFAGAGETDAERLSAQQQYFLGKTKYSFSDFSYQRMERRIRIPINIEKLYDCNYVMYLNSNFTNKWFYAFITNLEYANPEMTWITIELDVMQTWLTDYSWNKSFILREHVEDDTRGKHILPEDLETGEYLYYESIKGYEPMDKLLCVVTSTSTEYENVTGSVYNGIYSGCQFTAWDISSANGINALNDFLSALDYAGKGDAISSIFLFPSMFIEYSGDSHIVETGNTTVSKDIQLRFPASSLDGYIPKNNKMFTYPYFFIKGTNNSGNDALFECEYFENAYIEDGFVRLPFTLEAAISTNPTVVCIPRGYKIKPTSFAPVNYRQNYDCMLSISNYPQCQWSYGSYENWYAQNSAMINLQNSRIERNMKIDTTQGAVNTGIDALQGVIGLFTGSGINGIQSAANEGVETYQSYRNAQDDIKSNMVAIYQHSIQPPQTRGGTGGLGSNVALGIQNFFFYSMGINAYYAKIIDDYFSFYGYKVNSFEIPNTKSRKQWNYIQTIDCNIEGSFPDEHISKIKALYNKGITIWHNAENVNNYNLDNSIK